MSQSLLEAPTTKPKVDSELEKLLAKVESVDLIYDDGEPMESDWHVKNMTLLLEQIQYAFRDRNDFYVGGNMFIYFSLEQARNRDFRGPDFFYVANTHREPMRNCWVVWLEDGRTPNVVIELASPSTIDEDRGPKLRIYRDILRVANYFIYDRETRTLEGWRLEGSHYAPLELDKNGRMWSEELEMFLGTWDGQYMRADAKWLRFFDRDGNVVPLFGEAETQRADALAAENARLRELISKTKIDIANGSASKS
jgi:Uma2 family endonuclease